MLPGAPVLYARAVMQTGCDVEFEWLKPSLISQPGQKHSPQRDQHDGLRVSSAEPGAVQCQVCLGALWV